MCLCVGEYVLQALSFCTTLAFLTKLIINKVLAPSKTWRLHSACRLIDNGVPDSRLFLGRRSVVRVKAGSFSTFANRIVQNQVWISCDDWRYYGFTCSDQPLVSSTHSSSTDPAMLPIKKRLSIQVCICKLQGMIVCSCVIDDHLWLDQIYAFTLWNVTFIGT